MFPKLCDIHILSKEFLPFAGCNIKVTRKSLPETSTEVWGVKSSEMEVEMF
jgi:hypothetical protein